MDTRATHLLVEFHGCNPAILNDVEALRRLMRAAAVAAKATVVAEVFHPYAPHGVTGLLVIEESHFSLHTWPENAYAAADFYTCGSLLPELALELLRDGLSATRFESLTIERGRAEGPPFRVLEPRLNR